MAVVGLWAEALGYGCPCYLPVHGPGPGPADSQLLKVCLRGIGKQQQPWDQSDIGECPQFSGQSGRRLVVKRGEKREGAIREMVQGALCSVSCVCCLCLMYLLRHCLTLPVAIISF